MPFTPISAKNAVVRYTPAGGTIYTLTAKKWAITPKVDALDITNFEGDGFADWIGGILEADVTIDFDWDSDADGNPFNDPPDLSPGAIDGQFQLFTNGLTSPFWQFPLTLVVDTPQTAEVRGVITGTLSFKSKGVFIAPSN